MPIQLSPKLRLKFLFEKGNVRHAVTPEGLVYICLQPNIQGEPLQILLPELLKFGVGIKVADQEFTHGELLQFSRNGKIRADESEKEKWGPPGADFLKGDIGQSSSGRIATGESQLEELPEEVMPEPTQAAIERWLSTNNIPCVTIGLLKNKVTNKQSLLLVTGRPINIWNPTEALRVLTWFTPAHYYWSAVEKLEGLQKDKDLEIELEGTNAQGF